MKPYRLLRNNKETGPYSAEELIDMGLKAYDLVWVEGKSAAWRYPCEIPALKPYAPEAEDRIANFWKPAALHKKPANPAAASPVKGEKPRFRIRADWRRIDDSTQTAVDRNTAAPVLVAQPVLQERASAVSAPVVVETVVPEVKYNESLDSIKQRYNNSILRRTHAIPLKMGRYAWFLILVPALGVGLWIGSSWVKDKQLATVSATTPTAPEKEPRAISLQDALEDETLSPAPASSVAGPVTAPAETVPVNPVTTGVHVPQKMPAGALVQHAVVTTVTPGKTSLKTVTKTVLNPALVTATGTKKTIANAPLPAAVASQRPAVKPPVTNMVKTTATVTDNPPPAKAPATAAVGKQIADYVSVKEELQQYQDGKQMTLHVKNNTSSPVDLVVLDLQYYDSNGRFKKGETLYVNHLSGNDAVALNAPSVKNAQRIDYKISLLSIEKNGVYLIAE